ncbi:transient receptor potential cation channel subfamily V member 2-like [Pantherophis guttatus]|uniref:Transient receptor potential cation channel subfamily V member 2-like n=1 Tax=Pantherophis guttatus TaxID=94885 RepID=A0ABM3ZJ74_PANGU|nr:transient receptor potential cation channel subfamily V member 2-like [Pantherophis guttatus]
MAEDPRKGCWRFGKIKHRENQPQTMKKSVIPLETHHGPREDSNAAAKGAAGEEHGMPPLETPFQPEAPPSPRIRLDLDYWRGLNRPRDPNSFDRDRIFQAVVAGNPELLNGLGDYLWKKSSHLTDSIFRDGKTGKTCLMKALLYLKDGKNPTIPELLKIDKETQNPKSLVNAACTGSYYKGQTALHIAIEKRSLDFVKLLVENEADVHMKASGFLFQQDYKDLHFYFGELPLSLAACTNQPEMVMYLLDNPHQKARLTEQDSMGNTVLHALVMVAKDTKKNTRLVVNMYNMILMKGVEIDRSCKLEAIKNKKQLTPLTLAVKTGKVKMLKYMLTRKMKDPNLSRKFIEWTYGPLQTSVYDMTSIDSREENSALEVLAYNSDIPNRTKIVGLEPLNKLLQHKWESFIKKRFYFSLFLHLTFMVIFTATAYHWPPKDEPLVPTTVTFWNLLRLLGAVIVLIGGIYLFIAQIVQFWRRRRSLKSLAMDSCFDIFLFLQAINILASSMMFFANKANYVVPMVFALLLGWVNLLYYTRGFQQIGISIVMIQEAVLRDLFHFLIAYFVLLFGFATALVVLTGGTSHSARNASLPLSDDLKDQAVYSGLFQTTLLLFKFTIGMGDLEYHENLKHSYATMLMVLLFVIVTYILLLNMLIALMSNTVTNVSERSQSIWQLQRAITILEMEKKWIWCWKKNQRDTRFLLISFEDNEDKRWFFRIEEVQCGDLTKKSILREEPMETKTLEDSLAVSRISSSGEEEEKKDERVPLKDSGAQEESSHPAGRLSEQTPLMTEECQVQVS